MPNPKDTPRISSPIPGNYLIILTNPTTGEIRTIPLNELLTAQFIPDTTPPSIVSASVLNANTIRLMFSETVPLGSIAGWSSKKGGVNNPILVVDGIGTATLDFTVQNAIVGGDVILISYNPASGASSDGAGNEIATITDQSVTNSLSGGGGGDTTPPIISSKTTPNSGPNTIVVVFDEPVTVTTAGWSARRNGSNWPISSVAGSGTTWTFTMGTSAANGETLDISYNPATGNTLDAAGNELATVTNSSVTNNVSGSYDSDAQAFFTAAGITDTTQKNAVNQLVLDLKAASIWTKMHAVYPFVGGTASTHKWNLKNPLDTDGAFRLTFGVGVTHDSQGVDFSYNLGDNAESYFNLLSDSGGIGNVAIGGYIRNNAVSGNDGWFAMGGIETYGFALNPRTSGDLTLANSTDSGTNHSVANTDSRGMWILSRTSSTSSKIYKGGTAISTFTGSQTTLPNRTVGFGGANGPSGSIQDLDYQFGLALICDGLNDTEAAAFTTANNAFQTTLGRNV